jgi:mono/diheme cytochrome c family protein
MSREPAGRNACATSSSFSVASVAALMLMLMLVVVIALVGCAQDHDYNADHGTDIQSLSAPVPQTGSTPRTLDAMVAAKASTSSSSHTGATPALAAGGNAAPAAAPVTMPANSSAPPGAIGLNARALFLHNCAHCHGADAAGDEGPDLHHLDESGDWIAHRILNGKAGQMTAFKGKLKPEEIQALVAYVQSLK